MLGIEKGRLKIISDIVGRAPDSGESGVYASKILKLQGRTGYQNAEEELNRVCSLYGKGKYATGGRSIAVEDINQITGYDPEHTGVNINKATAEEIAAGTKYGDGLSQYGREVTFSWSGSTNKKPQYTYSGIATPGTLTITHNSFYWFDGKKWQVSNYEAGKKGEICKLTSNFYYYYPTTLTTSSTATDDVKGITTNSDEYKLLFDKSNFGSGSYEWYWLASKCIGANVNWVQFYVHFVGAATVNDTQVANSTGYENATGSGLRPVVFLKSDIQFKEQQDANGVWQFKENQ